MGLESYEQHQHSEAAGYVSEIGESIDESRIAAAAAGGVGARGDGSRALVVRAAESIAYSMDFDDTGADGVASHAAGSVSEGAYSQDFEEASAGASLPVPVPPVTPAAMLHSGGGYSDTFEGGDSERWQQADAPGLSLAAASIVSEAIGSSPRPLHPFVWVSLDVYDTWLLLGAYSTSLYHSPIPYLYGFFRSRCTLGMEQPCLRVLFFNTTHATSSPVFLVACRPTRRQGYRVCRQGCRVLCKALPDVCLRVAQTFPHALTHVNFHTLSLAPSPTRTHTHTTTNIYTLGERRV